MTRRIVLDTMWTTGDVMPFLRLGTALRRRGVDVTLVTHGKYASWARERDLDFVPIDEPGDYDAFAQELHLTLNPRGFRTLYEKYVLPKVGAQVAALRRACAASRSGQPVVVTRSTPAFAARMLLELDGIPYVPLFLAPSFVTSLPAVDSMFDVLAKPLDEIRAAHGLAPMPSFSRWVATPKVSLGAWPQWFAPKLPNAPPGIVYCGFFRELLPPKEGVVDPKSLIEDGPPPILLTGGTGAYLEGDFFRVSAEGCGLLDRPTLLLTTHDHLVPPHLPPQVKRVSAYLDFSTFMPYTSAVVHHGGIGTLAEALAAGVPQLVMGAGGDRPENAERLAALGVGAFLPPAMWSGKAVAEALERLLTNPSVSDSCRKLQANVLGERAYDVACDTLAIAELDTALPSSHPESGPAVSPIRSSTTKSRNPDIFEADPSSSIPPSSRAILSSKLATLSPAKRALLEKRLSQRAPAMSPTASAIERVPRDAPLALSFSQERLWILDQIEPNSAAYNIPSSIRLRGYLDLDALRRAFELVIQRHEVLRTSYRLEGTAGSPDARPVQVIETHEHFELPVDKASPSDLGALAEAEFGLPFSLGKGPMIRARLFKLEAREHVLLFTTHHIASDGWSTGILFSELAAAYDAIAGGRPPELRPLAVQYADFAAWSRARLSEESSAQKLAFWSSLLKDPPLLELPTDRPRPPRQRYAGGQLTAEVSEELTQRLDGVRQRESLTLYMILVSAFAALMERLSGQADLVIGSPVANRGRQELDDLIGFFVNTIALRFDLAGTPTWRELLARTKDLTLRAHAYQDVPFERVVNAVRLERMVDRSPLFQVLFAVQNTPMRPIVLRDVELIPIEFESKTSKFDLSLYVIEDGRKLTLSWEYDSALFDRSTVERFSKMFVRLVDAVVSDLDAPVQAADVGDAFQTTNRGGDRRAIAARKSVGSGRQPTTPSEKVVANIMCSVLGIKSISVGDEFFALGGNSLSAVMVVNRLRDAFRVELDTLAIFEKPTVEGLVAAVVDAWQGQANIVEEIANLTLEVESLSDVEVSARLGG